MPQPRNSLALVGKAPGDVFIVSPTGEPLCELFRLSSQLGAEQRTAPHGDAAPHLADMLAKSYQIMDKAKQNEGK